MARSSSRMVLEGGELLYLPAVGVTLLWASVPGIRYDLVTLLALLLVADQWESSVRHSASRTVTGRSVERLSRQLDQLESAGHTQFWLIPDSQQFSYYPFIPPFPTEATIEAAVAMHSPPLGRDGLRVRSVEGPDVVEAALGKRDGPITVVPVGRRPEPPLTLPASEPRTPLLIQSPEAGDRWPYSHDFWNVEQAREAVIPEACLLQIEAGSSRAVALWWGRQFLDEVRARDLMRQSEGGDPSTHTSLSFLQFNRTHFATGDFAACHAEQEAGHPARIRIEAFGDASQPGSSAPRFSQTPWIPVRLRRP